MSKKSAYTKQQEAIALAAQQKIDEANAPGKQLAFDLNSLGPVVISEYVEQPALDYRGSNYEENRSNFLAYIGSRYNLASLAHLDDEARGLEIIRTSALFFRVEKIRDERDKKTNKRTGNKKTTQSSIYCIGENASQELVALVEDKQARERAEGSNRLIVRGSEAIISKFAQAIDEKKAFYLVTNGRNQGTVKEEIKNVFGFFVERDDRRQSIESQMLEPLELGFSCNEQIFSGGKSVHHYITFKNCPDEGIPAEQAAELQQIIFRLGGYDGFINKDGGNIGDLKVKTSRMYGSYNQDQLIKGKESQVRQLATYPLLTFDEHWQLVCGKALGEYIPQADQPREIKADGTEGNILWAYSDVCDRSNWVKKFKLYTTLEDRKAAQLKNAQEKAAKAATQKQTLADLSNVVLDISQSGKAVNILDFLYPINRSEILAGTPDGTGRSHKRAIAIARDLFEIDAIIQKFGRSPLQSVDHLFESWISKTFQANEVAQIASARIAYSNASKNIKPTEAQVNSVRLALVAKQSLADKKARLFFPSEEAGQNNPHYGKGFFLPYESFEGIRGSFIYSIFICQSNRDALALSDAGFVAVSYPALSLINGELPEELKAVVNIKKDVYLVPENLSKTDWKANNKLMNSWEILGQKLTQELGKCDSQEMLKVVTLPYNFQSVSDLLIKNGESLFSQIVYEAISFRRWQCRHQRALYAPVDLSVNASRLTDAIKTTDIPNDAKKLIIKSTQGTGKTVFLSEVLRDYLFLAELAKKSDSEFFVRGEFTIILSHRIQLCADQAKKFDIARIEDEDQVILNKKGVIACFDSILKVESFLKRNNINRFQIIIDEFCQVDDHFLSSTTEIKNKRQLAANAFQSMLNQCDRLIASDADIKTSDFHYINELLPGKTFVIENTFRFSNRKVTVYKGKNQGLMMVDIYKKCKQIVEGKERGIKTKAIYISSQGQKVSSTWGTHNLSVELQKKFPSLKILVLSGDTLTETNHPASNILKTDINQGLKEYDIVIASPSIDTGVSIEEGHKFGWVYAFAQGTLAPTVGIQQFWRVRGDDVERSIWVSSLNQRKHGGETTTEGILSNIDHERTSSLNALSQIGKLIKAADDADSESQRQARELRDEALARIGKSQEEIQAFYDLSSCSVLPNGSEQVTEIYNISENWIFKKRYAATAAFYNISMKAPLDWVVEILDGQGCSITYPEISESDAELNKSIIDAMVALRIEQNDLHLDAVVNSREIGDEELELLEEAESLTKEQKKEVKKAKFNLKVGNKIPITKENLLWDDEGGVSKTKELIDLLLWDDYYTAQQIIKLEYSTKNKAGITSDIIQNLNTAKLDLIRRSGFISILLVLTDTLSRVEDVLTKKNVSFAEPLLYNLSAKLTSSSPIGKKPDHYTEGYQENEQELVKFSYSDPVFADFFKFAQKHHYDFKTLLKIKVGFKVASLFKAVLKLFNLDTAVAGYCDDGKGRTYKIVGIDDRFNALLELALEKRAGAFEKLWPTLEQLRFNKHQCVTSWAEDAIAGLDLSAESLADMVAKGKAKKADVSDLPVAQDASPEAITKPLEYSQIVLAECWTGKANEVVHLQPETSYKKVKNANNQTIGLVPFVKKQKPVVEAIAPQPEQSTDILTRGLGMVRGSELVEVLGLIYDGKKVQVRDAKGKTLDFPLTEVKPLDADYLANRYQWLVTRDEVRARKALEDLRKVASDIAEKVDQLIAA